MYQLPEYEPSDEVWKKIEAGLNENAMQKAISHLKTYEPTEDVWTGISQELNTQKTKLIGWQWLAVAASVLLIAGTWLFKQKDTPSISFSEEKLDMQLLFSSTDNSQKQYEMIVAYCKQQTYVCQNREFKELKSELEELNSASIQLKDAVGEYNTEPELMAQLTAIEQQKASVIRKMAMKI